MVFKVIYMTSLNSGGFQPRCHSAIRRRDVTKVWIDYLKSVE